MFDDYKLIVCWINGVLLDLVQVDEIVEKLSIHTEKPPCHFSSDDRWAVKVINLCFKKTIISL
jgi:hypothetical protein